MRMATSTSGNVMVADILSALGGVSHEALSSL